LISFVSSQDWKARQDIPALDARYKTDLWNLPNHNYEDMALRIKAELVCGFKMVCTDTEKTCSE